MVFKNRKFTSVFANTIFVWNPKKQRVEHTENKKAFEEVITINSKIHWILKKQFSYILKKIIM